MPPRAPKPLELDPTVLVEDVAIDHAHVFVATRYDTPLALVAHDGTDRRTLVAESDAGGFSRVVADDRGCFVAGPRGVCRVDKAGKVARLAPQTPWALALDATHVYGAMLGSYPGYADGGVFRIPREGGALEWLVTGRSTTAIAPAGDRLYFASDGTLHVREAGGAIHALAPAKNPHAIAVLGDAVIWTEFDSEGAPRCLAGGTVRALAAQPYTSDLVVVGDSLYWTMSNRKKSQPALWRMRLADEAPAPVAKFAGKAPRCAATADVIVWSGDSSGGVRLLPIGT